MSHLVRIKAGLTLVELPNGNSYPGGTVVSLTDDQYAALASTALGDEVLDVKNEIAFGNPNNDIRYLQIPIDLTAVVDGDQAVTVFTPGYAATIKAVRFIVDNPSVTAAKLTTLSLKIGTVAVTGGACALTTANTNTKAAVVAGTAVTAANVFTATDTIKAFAASTTAFLEGQGFLEALIVVT